MDKAISERHCDIPAHVLRHFTNQRHSGLSIRAYCKRKGISSWTFYNWRKFYKEPATLSPAKRSTQPVSFSSLGAFSINPGLCDIRLPKGITITVHRGATREELLPIITALAGRDTVC